MALDKTFAVGEVLNAADVNTYLLGVWTPIDKRVVLKASQVASISFQSLNSNFRMFQLTYAIRGGSGTLFMRFNNDSGTNYSYVYVDGTSGTASAVWNPGLTSVRVGAFAGSNVTGRMLIGKTEASEPASAMFTNANWSFSTVQTYSATWNNTSVLLNRIDIFPDSGTMYGIISLEGMRGV